MNQPATFSIRTATPADIPALHALIELSVRNLQQHDYTPQQIEGALGHALGLDTQLIEDATYFIAEPIDSPGQLAGCGGWSYRKTLFGSDHGPNRETSFLDPTTDAAKIRAIFIHPKYARKGLGTRILAHCEAAAQAAGFRRLTMGSTLTGVPLYTLKGYSPIERVSVPLPNGESLPIIVMDRALG